MTQTAKKGLYALGLQQPRFAYFNGDVRPWEQATLHVSCEAVNRGLNVFEGLKGYWQADGKEFGIVELRRHYDRLTRSARLLHIPVPVSYEEFREACGKLVRALYEPDKDMWIRATLFVVEGHWGEGTVADLFLTAYHQVKDPPAPVSRWRQHLAKTKRHQRFSSNQSQLQTTRWRDWRVSRAESAASQK